MVDDSLEDPSTVMTWVCKTDTVRNRNSGKCNLQLSLNAILNIVFLLWVLMKRKISLLSTQNSLVCSNSYKKWIVI